MFVRQVSPLSILILLFSTSAFAAERPRHPQQLTYPDLRFSLPQVKRVPLDNGLVVYLYEDHSLPIVDVYAVTRVGCIYEPPEKLGLGNITGSAMRTGGTINRTGEEIDELLEFMGASIETGIGRERGIARMGCMKKDTKAVLGIFAEILMHPQFRAEKIDSCKKEVLELIRRRNESSKYIVESQFRRLVYGDHPYGRPVDGEPDTVTRIEREDLVDFHRRYYAPNNTILGVSGDFDCDAMLEDLWAVFGSWSQREIVFPEIPALAEEDVAVGGVFHYQKELTQSIIRFGHLGIRRTDKDYIPVEIMNFILGGGDFTSRLMAKLRSGEGLAYSVYSGFQSNQAGGLFIVHAETKAETTIRALGLMKAEAERIRQEFVTEDELKIAKGAYLNRFVFNFTTARDIVSQKVYMEYEQLPIDYLDIYCEKIAQVTREDILRVAKKWLHPESLRILVVGDAERFDGSLDQFGPVHEVKPRDYAAEVDAVLRR